MKIKKGDTPELKLKKMDGSDFDLTNFKGKKVYLKYMRFASCMFCNLEVNHLKNKHSEFGKDFEIVLVFHSSVEFLNKQMKKHGPLPFTVLADPDFTYYKKYEIDRSMTKLINAFISLDFVFIASKRHNINSNTLSFFETCFNSNIDKFSTISEFILSDQ